MAIDLDLAPYAGHQSGRCDQGTCPLSANSGRLARGFPPTRELQSALWNAQGPLTLICGAGADAQPTFSEEQLHVPKQSDDEN